MELLDPGDQRGIAWKYANQRAVFATLPDKPSVLGRDEFPGAVALCLGLPDPLISKFLATKGPGDFHSQDKNGLLRRLDVYGNNLSLYMGKGHGRTGFHNEIQRTLASLARAVGHHIEEIPADVFVSAINPQSRDAYTQQIRQDRERGVFRGGAVPDLLERDIQQMHDVKTTGMTSDKYVARRSVVDLKAATVPAEYRSAARDVDRKYNGTPAGTVGPVEAMLNSMPQVGCFSVGAFGEVNKAVGAFLGKLADKGSDVPEHFGCCHGKEQAKGVVAQFLGRRLGRVLLRGVVKMRHKALMAIGGGGCPGRGARRDEAERFWKRMGRGRTHLGPTCLGLSAAASLPCSYAHLHLTGGWLLTLLYPIRKL